MQALWIILWTGLDAWNCLRPQIAGVGLLI
jgi:hypothetical protein